ncbi:autotransporter domain-containing protein [Bradyrhizobium sp. ORS 86]|uniref:autotransporter outer membrane beta-barrel domain-containing protein n=1 Tax=Bradyrhizobium sp. ORS 86 TaxID=1685970 RepID=UPI00388EAFD3
MSDGKNGGNGGDGLHATSPATLTVSTARITGGQGGDGGAQPDAGGFASGNGGAGGAGVRMDGGGTVTLNSGVAISGGNGGDGGESQDGGAAGGDFGGAGGAGIRMDGGGTVTLNSGATVTGGNGGDGRASVPVIFSSGSGGAGGAGVSMSGGGTVTLNSGATVAGGNGGDGGASSGPMSGSGGAGGTGVSMSGGGTVTLNSGATVAGGHGGAAGAGPPVPGATGPGGEGITGANLTVINAGSISGGLAGDNATRANAVTFTGGTNVYEMQAGASVTGNVVVSGGTGTFRLSGTGNGSFDISTLDNASTYAGFARFEKTGSSVWTLTGTSTYAGPVTVSGGTLAVNGDITSASGVTVNTGGTLGGNGIVGAALINGGTLAPGNSIGTLTMASLTLTAASTYLVQVSGASADKTIVTGIASLGGKVAVDPLSRVAATTTYTIMTAGTASGTFSGVDVLTASFARNARLTYAGNDVLLTLDPGLLSPALLGNTSLNQRNVAAGIDNALIGGAAMPAGFNALFALSGNPLRNALTQVSGETATGSQQTTFQAMDLFMGVLTDPFSAGRGVVNNGPTAFADESESMAYAGRARSKSPRDAFASFTKAPRAAFDQRWNVWAAGYGGSQTTDGNAVAGSNDTRSSIFGTAVGADYLFSPNTLAGFALAGGGTNFSVNNLGGGRSDLFQAGAYLRHTNGAAYVTGALAYGWQDITTNRAVTVAGLDQLRAEFNANAWSGRVEGGYRFVAPWFVASWLGGVGITPYAAGQFTTFDLPAYAESVVTGAGTFVLAYGAKSVTDPRSELGIRTDKSLAMADGILTLRGRLAWAHDFNPDRTIGATFQSLPGASFVVNGAAQASDSALVTASAEMKWASGWSAAASFEGELSNVTRSYTGKGAVRYQW